MRYTLSILGLLLSQPLFSQSPAGAWPDIVRILTGDLVPLPRMQLPGMGLRNIRIALPAPFKYFCNFGLTYQYFTD